MHEAATLINQTAPQFTIGWAKLYLDLPQILKIEACSFKQPWQAEHFQGCLKNLKTVCMVALSGGHGPADSHREVLGYMLYYLHSGGVEILNMAVAPLFRRMGIGAAFLDLLKGKLNDKDRRIIFARVRETNLPASLFMSSDKAAFKAVGVLRDFYRDTMPEGQSEDALEFVYLPGHVWNPVTRLWDTPVKCGSSIEHGAPSRVKPVNRVMQHLE